MATGSQSSPPVSVFQCHSFQTGPIHKVLGKQSCKPKKSLFKELGPGNDYRPSDAAAVGNISLKIKESPAWLRMPLGGGGVERGLLPLFCGFPALRQHGMAGKELCGSLYVAPLGILSALAIANMGK